MTIAITNASTEILPAQGESHFALQPGHVLIVSADASGSATIYRLADKATIGAALVGTWLVAANQAQLIGPYAHPVRMQVIADVGNVTVTTGAPDSLWPIAMSEADRDAIPTPAEGTLIYNLTSHNLNIATDSGYWDEILATRNHGNSGDLVGEGAIVDGAAETAGA